MSKAPPQRKRSPEKTKVGSRSFERQRKIERERAARRQVVRTRTRGKASADIMSVLRRVPTAAWVCVLVAVLNATAWSIIVPPFQGRDEVDHFAYTSQISQMGTLPKNGHEGGSYSAQQSRVMEALHYYDVRFTPFTPSISKEADQQSLNEAVKANASLQGSGEAGVATSEPPLYYALQTIPYAMGRGNMLAQLQFMRLFSVLLGAITVLLTFYFLREVVPSVPWAATIGALCVALQPLLAFMSGSVNPDTMLVTVTAAIFLCLARAFHRGLDRRLAIVLGALIIVGLGTKLNFIGVALGVFAGLFILGVREVRRRGWQAWRLPALAAGIGIAPVALYGLHNVMAGHEAFGIVSGTGFVATKSLLHEIAYIWQLYLPRLPGMPHYFRGMHTYKDVWFDRSVGFYGWMDTTFPTWVDNIALVPAGALTLLCARGLFMVRGALRGRLSELGAYAAICLGVLVMLGASSYVTDVIDHKNAFGEPRYLLPMVPLLGAAVVLAVRGAGRRWAPLAAAAIVVLFLGHDIFSQLQVIARYYG